MNFEYIVDLVKNAKKFVLSDNLINDVQIKGSANFVTAVDISINQYLKTELNKTYPNIGFFSEEETGELSDPCWILDPIDGTTNLIYGYNMSSISLALYKESKIVFGVVYNPFSDECFIAQLGKGSYMNGQRLFVSSRKFSESIIEFGAGSTRKEDADKNFELAKEIFKRCIDIRRICSSALDLCFIAAGRIDGYFEKKLKPWDYAAGSLILSEAGGIITDYSGTSISMAQPSSILAGNVNTHKELLKIIQEYEKVKC